jgi:hypothetical protein
VPFNPQVVGSNPTGPTKLAFHPSDVIAVSSQRLSAVPMLDDSHHMERPIDVVGYLLTSKIRHGFDVTLVKQVRHPKAFFKGYLYDADRTNWNRSSLLSLFKWRNYVRQNAYQPIPLDKATGDI